METTINNNFTWPPPYTLRYSTRVRSVRVQICQRYGLQIVVPKRFNKIQAATILERHRSWIERTWMRIQPVHSSAVELTNLPTAINLAALNETWQVTYQAEAINSVSLKIGIGTQLVVFGQIKNKLLIQKLLRRWLQVRARRYLLPWLAQVSAASGLKYNRANIRNTRTRWGSCSAKQYISLSSSLLFLPPTLVEHVMLHELCHTVYLNHSKMFWSLLKQHNPACHELRRQLKQMSGFVPVFFDEASIGGLR